MFCLGQLVAPAAATPMVVNAGFDDATTPALSNGEVIYNGPPSSPPFPTVNGWTFGASNPSTTAYDGMSNGVTFANENYGPFSGTQNAFVQGIGTVSQSIVFNPGTYTFSVEAVARYNGGESTPEPTAVTVGAQTLTFGSNPDFKANISGWSLFTSNPFSIAVGGAYTLSINGTVPLTTVDNLTGLDNVSFATAVPEPSTVVLFGLSAVGLFTVARRRRAA